MKRKMVMCLLALALLAGCGSAALPTEGAKEPPAAAKEALLWEPGEDRAEPKAAEPDNGEAEGADGAIDRAGLSARQLAAVDFEWLGTGNKPFIAQATHGGEADLYYFDIDLDGEAEIVISHWYNHWFPGLTEIFKFDGEQFVSVGGFFGRPSVWSFSSDAEMLTSLDYYRTAEEELVFFQGFHLTAGGSGQTVVGIVSLDAMTFRPVYSTTASYMEQPQQEQFFLWDQSYPYHVEDFYSYNNEELVERLGLTEVDEAAYHAFVGQFHASLRYVDTRPLERIIPYNLHNFPTEEMMELLGTGEDYETEQSRTHTNGELSRLVLTLMDG